MKAPALRMQRSPIQGWGVFAAKDFKTGEMICAFKGKPLSIAAIRNIYLNDKQKRISTDGLQIKERRYLKLDRLYNSMNHSCNPNAGMKKLRQLVAIRDIKKGEEITYDYSSVEWTPQDYTEYDHQEWPMHCNCGSILCRRLIACFPYLPQSIQRKYIRSGVIQTYILHKLKWPRQKQRCFVCEEILGVKMS